MCSLFGKCVLYLQKYVLDAQCIEFGCLPYLEDMFLIWKITYWCVSYLEDFNYFRSWRSNANWSVDVLCNMLWDQIINDFSDSRVCQNYYKMLARQQLSVHQWNAIPMPFRLQADGGPPLESCLFCFNCLFYVFLLLKCSVALLHVA